MSHPKKFVRNLERLLLPGRARLRRQRTWDAVWARGDFTEPWMGRSISKELTAAVADGWFRPGERALDIGCGQGEVAGWLAACGFPTVGIDFSPAAIERARACRAEAPGQLAFRVADITQEAPGDQSFGILVDRGCFHSLPRRDTPAYVEHVSASCAPGAHFLLFIKAFRGDVDRSAQDERAFHEHRIRQTFSRTFGILRCEETVLATDEAQIAGRLMPGLVFWMERTPERF